MAALPSSFTICVSVLVTKDHYKPVLFTLLGEDGSQWFIAKILPLGQFFGKRFSYKLSSQFGNIDTMAVFPNQWIRSCLSLNTLTGSVQWVARGELVDNSTILEIKKNVPRNLTNKIILGRLRTTDQMENKVSNLEIYSSSISVEKMQEFTKGEGCGEEGDYLTWKEWKLLHEDAIDHEEACYDKSLNFYPAQFPTMALCMHFCEKLGGGRAPPVATTVQWQKLETFFRKIQTRHQVWLPLDDNQDEGKWRDYYNRQTINFTPPWTGREPNGGTTENCVRAKMRKDVVSWLDKPCENYQTGACVCERVPFLYLELRGLCANSIIDKHYHPWNNFSNSNEILLVGEKQSTIKFDETRKRWNLSVEGYTVIGFSNASHHTYSLGKHKWSIIGDSGCTNEVEKELKLTSCKIGKFTCDDGQCVMMEQRCNQLPECRDGSDEKNCKVLVLKEGYNKNVPPVSVQDGLKNMVNVSVSIDILMLVDIDEEDYSVEIQFSIALKWIENRATYLNLKQDWSVNALTQEDIQSLWLPKVIYENTDQKESTRLGMQFEWDTDVVVERNKNGTPAGLDTLDETELFKGDENSLVMFQTYTHRFQCIFNLKKYPFDTQTCSIDMAMGILDGASVRLIPDQLHMKQSLDMPIFEIKDWRFEEANSNKTKTLKMIMVLKRKIVSELLTTYFPTLLLTAITFATTFFKPFFFEAALSVNLTTMLVMTTIFMSKMEGLPPTSDTKMIDIWLILCQIYPFFEVVLLTAMEYQREDENEPKSEILLVKSAPIVDESENVTPTMGELGDVTSRWKVPSLKTLGMF